MDEAAPTRVLVAFASRHGSTREIGQVLARCLTDSPHGRSRGLVASAVPVDNRPDPRSYDAMVLGSAVYAGRWLEPARQYATGQAASLRRRPVWLFSSGPIGAAPHPTDEPHDVGAISTLIGVRGHRLLPGKIDPSVLSFGERALVTAMRAPVGDFRDWAAVRSWAEEIAAQLHDSRTHHATTPVPAPT